MSKDKANQRSKGRPKIIAIIAQKGGVGKSTVSCQLAVLFSTFGKKVLMVNSDTHQNSIGDALRDREDANIVCVTIPTKNLRRELSKDPLTGNFDIVIIDGEGHIHEHSKVALETCDYFIVPILPSQFDLNSYDKYVNAVVEPTLEYKDLEGGVFLNQDESDASSTETIDMLTEYPLPVFSNSIIRSKLIRKSSVLGMGIAEYRRNTAASKSIFKFSKELINAAEIKIKNFTYEEFAKRSLIRRESRKGVSSNARAKEASTNIEKTTRVQLEPRA